MRYYPAPQYQVTKNVERPFPWWRRTCELVISSNLHEGQLSRVVDGALTILFKAAFLSSARISSEDQQTTQAFNDDYSAKRLVNISACPNLPLLSITGTCVPLEDEGSEAEEAFNITLGTNFLEFDEGEKIIFTVASHIQAPADITFSEIPLLGRLLNLKPERFSLSLGFFKPTYISSSLGAVPEMLEGLELTGSSTEMRLRIWSESLPRGKELPLTEIIGPNQCWLSTVQEFLRISLGEFVNI